MSQYKYNHIIPKGILKNFKNGNGDLYYFDKQHSSTIRARNAEGIFQQKDLYVSTDEYGRRDTTLETDHYGQLDDQYAIEAKKLISNVRDGRLTDLNSEKIQFWFRLIYHMNKRSPEFFRKPEFVARGQTLIDGIVSVLETSSASGVVEAREWLNSPEGRDNRIKFAALEALRSESDFPAFFAARRGYGLRALLLPISHLQLGVAP